MTSGARQSRALAIALIALPSPAVAANLRYCSHAERAGEQALQDMSDKPTQNSDFVQSLERGLAVIRAFDAEHRELALSEVARLTGLTRAAARRFLLTLVKLGY